MKIKKLLGVVAIAALAFALTGCTATADKAPVVKLSTYEQALLDSDIKVGDCILSEWGETFEEVSCDVPHSDEVYSVVKFDGESFEADVAKIAESYISAETYQDYIGGELPTVTAEDGKTLTTIWSIRSHSFAESKKLWDAGFKKAFFTIGTDKLDEQVGSVKGAAKDYVAEDLPLEVLEGDEPGTDDDSGSGEAVTE